MLFAVHALDRPNCLALRAQHREAHIAFLTDAGDRLKFAGPLLDDAGGMCGSLLILEAENRATLARWLEDDPYSAAGLFERVTIRAVKPLFGPMAAAL
ncbi:YciI family protein [Hyphobacterium marinum]|uniref:YciI family protein n=1 Tax=Hyphobacterium marinum TaxID=3116574 RepID=A0ABU7LUR1_9PROT|nr:YciI family protein [Hyphobacterium sp. Y6023]MEE2565283.1 YciI family protein [Hyphobacterium sp. Y6023]